MEDLKLALDVNATYIGSNYVLSYANGDKEYIGSGLVAKTDRFGNVITYTDTVVGGIQTLQITDTNGRKVSIAFGTHITVTLPDNSTIKYNRSTSSVKNMSYTVLSSKTDQKGLVTTFTYTPKYSEFDYFHQKCAILMTIDTEWSNYIWLHGSSKTNNKAYKIGGVLYFIRQSDYFGMYATSYCNDFFNYNMVLMRFVNDTDTMTYHNLTKVTYPTGATTEYTYGKSIRRLGPLGNTDYYYVKSRADYAQGTEYNKTTYTYGQNGNTDNNYTAYSLGELSGEVPDTYRYYVKEQTGSITTTYTFNKKHQMLEKQVVAPDVTTTTTSTFNTNNLCDSVQNKVQSGSNGYTTKELYEYDNYANVTAYWSPLSEGIKTNTEYKTTYTYDGTYQQLLSKTYKQNKDTTITDKYTLDSGKKYAAKYEQLVNNVQNNRIDFAMNTAGALTSIKSYIDSANYIEETYTYKDNTYVLTKTLDGVSEKFTYDTMGNMLTQTDKNGNLYESQYDTLYRVLKTTNPDKTYISNAYDDKLNTVTVTNELGNQIKYTYNPLGLIVSMTDLKTNKVLATAAYDSMLTITSETDGMGEKTTYTYNNSNMVTQKTKGVYTEKYIYELALNNAGDKVTTTVIGTNGAPDIKTAAYADKYGRVEYNSAFNGSTEIKNKKTYDYLGNVILETNTKDLAAAQSYTTLYTYNANGKTTKTTDALGNEIKTAYDYLGRITAITDAKGSLFKKTYNSKGLLSEETVPFEGNYNQTKKYTYDNNGNVLTSAITTNKPGETAKSTITTYTYDKKNRPLTVESDGITTTYAYDSIGNKTQLITGNGAQITTYEYDHLSRLTKLTDALNQWETYGYDDNNNLVKKVDRNGTNIINTYDKLNRLTQTGAKTITGDAKEYMKSTYSANGLLLTTENENLTTTNTYDNLGRIITQTDSDGTKRSYTYDLNNNRTSFKLYIQNELKLDQTYEYDRLNRLVTVLENGKKQASYTYDVNGNRASMTLGNGIITTYDYNKANLVTSLSNKDGSKVISSFTYSYYLDGNQVIKTENTGKVTSYVYDD